MLFTSLEVPHVQIPRRDTIQFVVLDFLCLTFSGKIAVSSSMFLNPWKYSNRARRGIFRQENTSQTSYIICTVFWVHNIRLGNAGLQNTTTLTWKRAERTYQRSFDGTSDAKESTYVCVMFLDKNSCRSCAWSSTFPLIHFGIDLLQINAQPSRSELTHADSQQLLGTQTHVQRRTQFWMLKTHILIQIQPSINHNTVRMRCSGHDTSHTQAHAQLWPRADTCT